MAAAPAIDPVTANVLREAVVAAQSGQIADACTLAEAALVRGGDAVALNAFLGMLRARSGELPAAIRHLQAAHSGRPSDATIACNLIAALIDAKALEDAFCVATDVLARADPSQRIARYRGFLAQSLSKFDVAAESYEQVVSASPEDFESWNNLGNARSALGDGPGSIAALKRAVALDPTAPPTRLNLAAALCSAGRNDEANDVLRLAMKDFPGDARAAHDLYVLLKQQSNHVEALPAIEEAAARDPGDASLQLKLGVECGLVNRIADAEAAFRRAVASDPLMVDAYLGLAVQYEHTNREDDFAPLIALGVTNGLDKGALAFIQTLEHRRAKRFEAGLASLALVPEEIEPQRTVHMRATLLDRLGDSDGAFTAFEEANRLHIASPTEPLVRAAEVRKALRVELDTMTPQWTTSWLSAPLSDDPPDPVFLVGFPRSGTTLLDTILMGHPDTVVMEEQPPLNRVDKDIGGLQALATLDQTALVKLRSRYFEEVRKVVSISSGQTLIDKSPLFLSKVPLIYRLFPNARFILALRHPCDVVLSCFMSNFRLNDAMSNFLRLEDAATFYDSTFRHWERAVDIFSPRIHSVVYERLVGETAREVRPVFDFLGLDWHEPVLDHQSTAKSRGLITTASYSQVTEPIYKRAAGRWTRYRRHLDPVLPTLAPWIDRFGYTI